MELTRLFLADLDAEAGRSRKALEQVPEGHYDWKPHEKSMHFGYLSELVATMPSWVAMAVNQDSLDLKPTSGQGYQRPRDFQAEKRSKHGLGLDREQPVDPDLQTVVGHDREDCRGKSHRLAHGQCDVGVEAAGGFDVLGHCHESDGEYQQHRAGDDVAHGGADAPDSNGYGGHAGHDGKWGRCGDHQEGDAAGADGVPFEPVSSIGCWRSGFQIRHGDPMG